MNKNVWRTKAHVLATTFSDKAMNGSGTNEPMVVVTEYGKGRVLNCAMGHDPKSMAGVGFQALMLRGAEWAATGKVTIPVPADWPALGSAQAKVLEKTADPAKKKDSVKIKHKEK